jgi:hypothetical protein
MADSNRVDLLVSEETTWGETPSSPAMTILRFTGETLKYIKKTEQSAEIDSERDVTDEIKVGEGAEGGLNGELTYATFDNLLEGALGADFVDLAVSSSAITFTNSDSSLNGTALFGAFAVGDKFRVEGSGDNDGVFTVVTATANKVTVEEAITDEAPGAAITISGKSLRNGTTKKSFCFEKRFKDISEYLNFRGMRVSKMTLEIEAEKIVGISFEFMGQKGVRSGSTIAGSAAAKNTNPVFNAAANVGSIKEGGAALSTGLRKVTIDIDNNAEADPKIGSFSPDDIAYGECDVMVDVDAYFRSSALYVKFQDHTSTSLELPLTDDDGNAYYLKMGKVRYLDGDISAGGANQRIIIPLRGRAVKDSTLGCSILICAVPKASA